jgi:NADH-quinone oxidoreductase subunit L
MAYLWLIPALPLAASILTGLLGPRVLRGRSHWPCILALLGSCALSVLTLAAVAELREARAFYGSWFQGGAVEIEFTLRADALTAIMLVTVTFVGSLIAIYSVGYMHGDPGYARFFAEIAFFIFCMTGLVMANNFLLLYAFWEGVGLCSYLLIGFWFTRPAAAAAARKAFLVTRLGDVGFLIGILIIWSQFWAHGHQLHSLDYDSVFHAVKQADFSGSVALVCLLLFCGAVGKSAQFPLYVWLPDAMEGPTPVSALIHAATMVTAGVYMVARCTPLFERAPEVQVLVATIGGFTALLAALIALTQNDLKRVLAYSTISQLGYMFMALGSATRTDIGSSSPLVAAAVVAAIFHLFTHAFFKALLFLGAGSVMHALGNVIDMRRFGGLRFALRTTHWTFLAGAAALAGLPLLSGFWSKDEILGAVLRASDAGHPYQPVYTFLFILALAIAGLTAFYTFRAYFLTFWGEYRVPPEAGDHPHESPPLMRVPLIILALGAVLVGYFHAEPLAHWLGMPGAWHWFGSFMETTPIFEPVQAAERVAEPNLLPLLGGICFALGGVALAGWMYVIQPGLATRLTTAIKGLYQWSLNKFYVDEIYEFFIVKPVRGLAEFCGLLDSHVIDGFVDLAGNVPRLLGLVFRPIQNGLVQFYALSMGLGMVVFLVAIIWRHGF